MHHCERIILINTKYKDMDILIGKEPGNGRLMIAVGQKAAMLGAAGSVPNTVSRCKPAEGIAHCMLSVADNGDMTVKNLKLSNITCVDGAEVMQKKITFSNAVTLGAGNYKLDLQQVVNAAKVLNQPQANNVQNPVQTPAQPSQPQSQPEYSILHLKRVWEDYHDKTMELKLKSRNLSVLRSSTPLFTLGGGFVAGYGKQMFGLPDGVTVIAGIMGAIGLVLMIYSFYLSYKDKSLEEGEKLTDDFQSNYVCPNPHCHRFVGNQPYKLLRQNKNCPYCKCKWTE